MQIRLQFTPEQALRSLFWLRTCAIVVQALVICALEYATEVELPLTPMLAIVGGLALWNTLTLWRLRQPWAATQAEVALHLAIDALALTGLLYLSGGPSNPFVSFYLVSIAIAAAILSRPYAWTVTTLCIGAYSLLMWNYAQHSNMQTMHTDFRLHVFGMWANFLLSAILIGVFITAMAAAVRRREQSLARAREKALRDEYIVAIGTLAAGAAHELGTPLSTIAVIAGELRQQYVQDPLLAQELRLLSEQIGVCKQQLGTLLEAAGQRPASGAEPLPLRTFLESVFDRWRLMHPTVHAIVEFSQPFDDSPVRPEPTFAQSVLNALNNAAQASTDAGQPLVELQVRSRDGKLTLDILDSGSGLDDEQRAQAGRAVFSTKPDGLGIGLVLSHASLERLGGEISLEPRSGGGTRTRLSLPLDRLAATA